MIGPLTIRVSGTTNSFKELVSKLRERQDIDLMVVNASIQGPGLLGFVGRLLRVFAQVVTRIGKADVVSVHMNEPHKALPVWFLAFLARKPLLVRWFGGTDYRNHGSLVRKWSAKWLIRHSDMNLFQTKLLVRESIEDGAKRSAWLSNSRVPPKNFQNFLKTRKKCRKFVFLGRVVRAKGIPEILEAARCLSDEATIDIFGPLKGSFSQSDFSDSRLVRYCGVLPQEKVIPILLNYDALLLPTSFHGEGYSGAVIEAYFAGIPVICTKWRALPEIVDETSGILIPPHDADALLKAMQKLMEDEQLYRSLCKGALEKSELFLADKWTGQFVHFCIELQNAP